jgi:hypothetical protein
MSSRTSGSRRRRLTTTMAVAATVPFLGGLGAQAQAAAPAAAASPLSVVATGLNNPRHLHFRNGRLYVAEAGVGGTGPCAPGEAGNACVGRTGDIAVVGVAGSTTRIMKGLSSVASAHGVEATGPADVTFVGSNPVAVVQDTNITTKGGNPFGPQGNDLGHLVVGLNGGAGPSIPGPDFAKYEAAHNPDGGAPPSGPGSEPPIDSDPYGVTAYHGGFAVADAAGNDILFVNPHGLISTLAVIPTNNAAVPSCFGAPPGARADFQAVPTSVRVGPDGALYVPELSGATGAAKVLRVVPGHAPTVYASGFDSITDIAFDAKGRLLVLQLAKGGLFCPTGPGSLIRVDKSAGTRTTLTNALSTPTGLAVNGSRVFISNNGASPADGTHGGDILSLVEQN